MIGDIFLVILQTAGIVCTLIGVMFIVQLINTKDAPMDDSNIFNHARIVWFALTRPEELADAKDDDGKYLFPWMHNDELENVKQIKDIKK